MWRIAACLAVLTGACSHQDTHSHAQPCDGYVELRFETVPARTGDPVLEDMATGSSLLVRCAQDQEFRFAIDSDRGPDVRCGEVVRLIPGSHRVIVPGHSYFELEAKPGDRVVIATTRRVHNC
jgi:hypothetical protein